MVLENNPVGPSKNKYILRAISEESIDEITVVGKQKSSNLPIEEEFINSVFTKVLELIKDPEVSEHKIQLPNIDSGGSTKASILSVCVIRRAVETEVGVFLERDGDRSAGTIAGKTISYKGEPSEELLQKLYEGLKKIIKSYSKILAGRSDLRQTVTDFIKLQNLKRNAGNN